MWYCLDLIIHRLRYCGSRRLTNSDLIIHRLQHSGSRRLTNLDLIHYRLRHGGVNSSLTNLYLIIAVIDRLRHCGTAVADV